ncbi:AbrB family transcriptional regulator [Niveispirillum irakense]|uniref:AbrB family transcriptional regulator n=1 Tax=Niveispirillum irakense TaxID=34011 RepID=UPI00040C8182|nr:AbrB family transcriptional regulator [Niveispirillum irakense]
MIGPAVSGIRNIGWKGFATAMLLGLGGGYLCFRLHVPLAFMIGAMIATTLATLAGIRTSVPPRLRNSMMIILGIMLGSAFTPALLDHLREWTVSLAGLIFYIVFSAGLGLFYLQKVAGYDRVTGYFTAMPGGFNEMVMMGGALGGDDRTIALGHSLRVMLVVMTVPVAFQSLPGYDPAGRDWSLRGLGPGILELPWTDYGMMVLCGAGAPLAQRLRIPAGVLVGPMLLSAGLHLAGLMVGKPPGLVIAGAQIIIGASIGARFAGLPILHITRTLAVAAGLTFLLLSVTVGMAVAVHLITGLSLPGLILAYAPGGLAEMSLVALALHVDAAFVASHHIVRIILIVLFAPPAFHLWRRWATRRQ